ncbi:condensation domain-containing protein [Floridanema aerugineum]|uniref:Phthiocerol/phthiodiolone dimycocerosyl transferase n=1 Tax=Floridaenema aerugineum BLCC-F46 TaxID=3153654 RepID=A0ABV4X3P7_9CYAN
MNRKLGLVENLFEILHDLGGMIDVNVARIEGQLTGDTLQQALYFVQKRHPMLQVRIVQSADGAYFESEGTAEIPLRVIDKQHEKQWIEIAEDELHEKFYSATTPLCRVTFLRSSISNGISEIIATFHHAITDGMSCMRFFDDLFSYCRQIAAGEQISKVVTMELLPPLETLLKSSLTENNNLEEAPEKPDREIPTPNLIIEEAAPANERRTRLVTRILSKEMTLKLINRCKQEQTTVHGTLCAAMLFEAAKIASNGVPINLSCGSNVNLRKYCNPEVKDDYMGCLVSGLEEKHSLDKDTEFWSIARECKLKISQSINRRFPHYRVSSTEILEKFNIDFITKMSHYNGGRSSTTHISNIGSFNLPNEYGHFRIKELYFATGQHIVGTCFWLGVVTFHEQVFFTFAHVVPIISDKTAESFADSVINTIQKACTSQSFTKLFEKEEKVDCGE